VDQELYAASGYQHRLAGASLGELDCTQRSRDFAAVYLGQPGASSVQVAAVPGRKADCDNRPDSQCEQYGVIGAPP
jgi:hypothetical protein